MTTEETMESTAADDLREGRLAATVVSVWNVFPWALGLFLTRGGQAGVMDGALLPDHVATGLVAAIMLGALGVALVLRRRALRAAGLAESRARSQGSAIRETMVRREDARKKMKSFLLYAWGTLGMAMFFCGVIFIVMATPLMLPIALSLFAAGVALTFPRAQWYGGGGADA